MNQGGRRTAAVVAAALVLLSAAGALLAQDAVRDRDRAVGRDRIAADGARVEAAIALAVSRTSEIALQLAASGEAAGQFLARRSLNERVLEAVAELDAGSTRLHGVLTLRSLPPIVPRGDVSDLEPLAQTVRDALDSTTARTVAPVELDAGPAFVVVAPVIEPGRSPDVSSRRAAARGVVLGVVTIERLRNPPGAPAVWPGAGTYIQTPTGTIGERPADVAAVRSIDAGHTAWRVAVGPIDGPRRVLGWFVLGLGLAIAAAVYGTLRNQHQRQVRAEAEADARARQLEMIAGTSAALQQSLDLADLLPAFCVSIVDEFHLRSAAVLVVDDDGHLVEVFRFGEGWPSDTATEVDLRRGRTSVGRLVTRSPRHLDAVTIQSLQALGDLLAVAVSNAALYQREQQAVSRLSELDALKNAFLGTVSHELRTSTTAVQGFGELLVEHWDTLPEERRRELAARIRRQAGSLRHLVDDLLDYARLEHQSLRVLPRQVSLTEVVRGLTESMSPLVADHDIVFDAPDDVTAWVDPVAVERILANLLSNAGKYAPAGSQVVVRVVAHGSRARLQVADQGPGIPESERQRVFVRFYRVPNETTVRTRGAGIGLSILHDFAERSGATVAIDDAPGGGALITVDFPTAAPAPEAPTMAEHAR